METKRELIEWARAHRGRLPKPRFTGCPCGCMTKRPYLIDPDCTAEWPVRPDPVCGPCGAVLDPDGSCFVCCGLGLDDEPLA